MIINICGFHSDMAPRKKMNEVKSINEGMKWVDKYIAKREKSGDCHHFYTRITFYPDSLVLDYGEYNNFVVFSDLPEDYKEQLEVWNEKEKEQRNK